MVTEIAEIEALPPTKLPRSWKAGPKGRTDVRRPPACPQGHVGTVRVDRVRSTGLYYTRIGYRCAYRELVGGVWEFRRHRFTDAHPDDPLPRRHPVALHPHNADSCPTCEERYAPDGGPRIGRNFLFNSIEIAQILLRVGEMWTIRQATADARRKALLYRPLTASHLSEHEKRAAFEDYAGPLVDDGTETVVEMDSPDADLAEPAWLTEFIFAPDDADYDGDEPLRLYGRQRAFPRRRYPPPADPHDMAGNEKFLSKSFATGAEYVDVFGPLVTAPFAVETWPEAIAIDSQPVRRKTVVSNAEETRVASDFLVEIFAVEDALGHELIALYPAGSKDRESIKEVFASKTGAPSWIVTDGDTAMPYAIRDAFPAAIHYRCEDHLRKDAEDAARKDKLLDTPSIRAAIENAQHSPAHWQALKATVPETGFELRGWIERNEALVLHQVELRKAHPDMPRATGAVEAHLTAIRARLDERKFGLRNRERLIKVLDLTRVQRNHRAHQEAYTVIVRRHLEDMRFTAIPWSSHWDKSYTDDTGRRRFPSSLTAHRDMARERNAIARVEDERAASAAWREERLGLVREANAAAGGVPYGRILRDRARVTLAHRGQKVADVPSLMAFWDPRNTKDPSEVSAQSSIPCNWICQGHAAGDPQGRWEGHPHEWPQTPARRAHKDAGCPFCRGRKACKATSLRATHPALVKEWADPVLSPDDFTFGSNKVVLWHCQVHGDYPLEIRFRARFNQHCPRCTKTEMNERARRTKLDRDRAQRIVAAEARKRAGGI